MSVRTVLARRRIPARIAAVGVATVAAVGAWAPAAGAAPGDTPTTVVLSPTDVSLSLLADQVAGRQPLAPTIYDRGSSRVPVAYGGAVTFQLPPQLASTGPALTAALELAPGDGASPTRTYRSDSAVPADALALTDLGSGRYRVDLPTDDGINGPAARLALGTLAPTTSGVQFVDPAHWSLQLSASAPTAVELTSQLIATAFLGCGAAPSDRAGCPVTATTVPGGTIAMSLPADSALAGLGIPDLSRSAFALTPYDASGQANGTGSRVALTAAVSPDGRTATLTLPAGIDRGRHLLSIGLMDSSGRLFTLTWANIEVGAAPNAGLRSNTGWGEGVQESGSGTSPLVPLGAGIIVVAGAVTVTALRARRRTDAAA